MLKSLTDLSVDSLKQAVSSAIEKMDGGLHRQLRVYRREADGVGRREVGRIHARMMPPVVNEANNGQRIQLLFPQPVPPAHVPHPKQMQSERITIKNSGSHLSYEPQEKSLPGVFIGPKCLQPDSPADYFEVEIVASGLSGEIALGLVPWNHPLDQLPGFNPGSVGYHAGDGKVYLGHQRGSPVTTRCLVGDKIGCGVRLENPGSQLSWLKANKGAVHMLPFLSMMKLRVFFTKNGNEIASTLLTPLILRGGLFPAVGLSSPGEAVKLSLNIPFVPDAFPSSSPDDTLMCVDSYEDDWMRLHEIRLNGTILEYAGRGKSILDVGLAQARKPLDTHHHYFEIEIVDPGENCYIAIGLTKKEYPHQSHPGWNKGSIAYHADDGKIFMGSGAGDPFGPRCHRGDIMGCGIIFPRDFLESSRRFRRKESLVSEKEENNSSQAPAGCSSEDPTPDDISSSQSEEEILFDSDDSEGVYDDVQDANGAWVMRPDDDDYRLLAIGRGFPVQFLQERRVRSFHRMKQKRIDAESDSGPSVQVFFSRNGTIIGQKEMKIPRGGFYPTIGMLSSAEKVRVDLYPFTG